MPQDIRTLSEIKDKKIAFAGSGGLDSCTITRWLSDSGIQVVCLTADLGQPDEEDITDIEKRMRASGAVEFHLLDLKEDLAEAGLRLINAGAQYEGGYWNTTGIARHVIAQGVVTAMKELGLSVLAHGATGRGNDQVRFQLVAHMLAPEVQLYAPWRDSAFLNKFKGRAEMIDYCQSKNLPIKANKNAPYSTDANLLGLTHEAGKLESLETAADFVTAEFGKWPTHAPDSAEDFAIRFEAGRPVRLNGKKVGTLEALTLANEIGGRNGVGIGLHVVENRVVGLKSRGIYEQPGMELLGKCYRFLLQLILDQPARAIFDSIAPRLGDYIYNGRGFDLASQIGFAAAEPVRRVATGTIKVRLYKGNVIFVAAEEVPHCMYSEEATSMEAVGDFDHSDSEGLLRIFGLGARTAAKQGLIKDNTFTKTRKN